MNLVVSFQIGKEDFINWVNKKGWDIKIINNLEVNNISNTGNPNDSIKIPNGLLYQQRFNKDDPGSTRLIYAYNIKTHIGYFTKIGD